MQNSVTYTQEEPELNGQGHKKRTVFKSIFDMIGISSTDGANNLNSIQKQIADATTRLTTGKRVNSSADDAAGLAIISRLEAIGKEFETGVRNASDAISVAQVSDAAVSGVESNLQRLRELAVQSANGILSDADRASIAAEADQIKSEINRVTQETEFNGNKILQDDQNFTIQLGSSEGDQVSYQTGSVSDSLASAGLADLDLSTQEGATAALNSIDNMLSATSSARSEFGAITNRMESAISNLQSRQESVAASKSRIEDADFAKEAANLSRGQLLENASIAVKAQANADAGQILRLLAG